MTVQLYKATQYHYWRARAVIAIFPLGEGETELTIHTGAMLALHHIEQKSKNLTIRNSILTLSATNVH